MGIGKMQVSIAAEQRLCHTWTVWDSEGRGGVRGKHTELCWSSAEAKPPEHWESGAWSPQHQSIRACLSQILSVANTGRCKRHGELCFACYQIIVVSCQSLPPGHVLMHAQEHTWRWKQARRCSPSFAPSFLLIYLSMPLYGGCEGSEVLQSTQVLFPAPMSGGSQPPVTEAPEDHLLVSL